MDSIKPQLPAVRLPMTPLAIEIQPLAESVQKMQIAASEEEDAAGKIRVRVCIRFRRVSICLSFEVE
jgi:hypothetical protein